MHLQAARVLLLALLTVPTIGNAFPIVGDPTEILLTSPIPLGDFGILVEPVNPAEVREANSRRTLVLPILGGEQNGDSFTLNHLGGLRLERGDSSVTLSNIRMSATNLKTNRSILTQADLYFDDVLQRTIDLDTPFCDQVITGVGSCIDEDLSSFVTGLLFALEVPDARAAFNHLGLDSIIVPQLGIAFLDIRLTLPEPEPARLVVPLLLFLLLLRSLKVSTIQRRQESEFIP